MIEHAQQMLRIGIAAVDAVAEDRHVGASGFRHDEQFVHGLRKAVDHDLRRVGRGIEKQDLGAHLVDRDHAVLYACHCLSLRCQAINLA